LFTPSTNYSTAHQLTIWFGILLINFLSVRWFVAFAEVGKLTSYGAGLTPHNKDVFSSILGLIVIILIFVGLPTKLVVSLARRAHKKLPKRRRLYTSLLVWSMVKANCG